MTTRERWLMDPQWRFFKGDFPFPRESQHWAKGGNCTLGPIEPAFDDSKWRLLDLPHDFVVEGNFNREAGATTGSLPGDGTFHMMHGFLPGGVGWYRKVFFVPKEDLGRLLALEFDGVFRNSTVWLNRNFVGNHLSGYMGIRYDISDLVQYGEWNTLVVRVDATEYEGWFYEGGGIYRHVWLEKTDRLRVAPHGAFVRCEVDLSGKAPRVTAVLKTTIRNDYDTPRVCNLVSSIQDPGGKLVAYLESAATVGALATQEVTQTVEVPDPALWSLESPSLYTLVSTVSGEGRVADECRSVFGIRKIDFDPERGCLLNDKPVKLQGVCCHQDHAGVGSALPDRLQEFRIVRLKEMGCNAYRSAHHPPTPELLDACDRLGMLVMDEHRILGTAPDILQQLDDLVCRDRNHPSVILWSLGNEEVCLQGTAMGARIAATMKNRVRRLDPSRLVTLAMNGAWGQGASDVIDVLGCNYIKCGDIDAFHQQHPRQPVVFSESASALGTRGIYAADPARGYVSAYDVNAAPWGNTHEENWKHCDQRPFVAGTFVWTGFDYRGEPTPYYAWPCISSHFGIIDTCGFPKDVFYYYQAWWTRRTVLHILPHWNLAGREGEEIDVWVYSNCDAVELFLNGRSLGRKDVPRAGHLEWKVNYAPGALTATGFRGSQSVASAKMETTGPAHAVRLVPESARLKADGEDVAVVRAEVVDSQGRMVPEACNQLLMATEGPGRIIGVGNGDPSCHEADKGIVRCAFNGLAQVIVQSLREAGPIRLKCQARGLIGAELLISPDPCTPRPWLVSMGASMEYDYECSDLRSRPTSVLGAEFPAANVVFRPATTFTREGLCDVRSFHGEKDGLVYIRVKVPVLRDGGGVLCYGADGPVKVWVNGAEAGAQPTAANPAKAEEYSARVRWREGENQVVFALVTNQGKAWGVFVKARMG